MVHPGEGHKNWLSSAKWPVLKTYTGNKWTQQVIFRNIHVYTNTYMHAVIIREKRCYEFKGKQGRVYGVSGGRKGEEEML